MNVAAPSISTTDDGDVCRCDFPVWFLNGEEFPRRGVDVDWSDGRFARQTVVTKTEGVGSDGFKEEVNRAIGDVARLNNTDGFRARELELEALEGMALEGSGMTLETLRAALPEGLRLPDDVNFPRAFKLFTLVILAGEGTEKEKKEAMTMFVPPARFNRYGGATHAQDLAIFDDETRLARLEDMVNILIYTPGPAHDKACNMVGLPGCLLEKVKLHEKVARVAGGGWFEAIFSQITIAMAYIELGYEVVPALCAVKGHKYLDVGSVSLEAGMALLDECAATNEKMLSNWSRMKETSRAESRDSESNVKRKKKAFALFNGALSKREEPIPREKRNQMYREFYSAMEQVWQVDFLFEYFSEVIIVTKPKQVCLFRKRFYLVLFAVYRENHKAVQELLGRVAAE